MNIYTLVSLALTVFIYFNLASKILKGNAQQNLATWISWGLLDTVVAVSLWAQGGNWYLASFYVAGCGVIICCIFRTAKFQWGKVETFCFILVVLSLVAWTQTGAQSATIISTLGVAIATFPQIKDTFLFPKEAPTDVYVAFTVVNLLAVLGGKAWTIEERLYPFVCVFLTLTIVVVSLKKYFSIKKPRNA